MICYFLVVKENEKQRKSELTIHLIDLYLADYQ